SWPAGVEEPSEFGTMYWLMGQNTATIDVTISADAAPGSYDLRGELFFMACTEEMCLAPSVVELNWPVEVVAPDYAADSTVDPYVFNESFPVSYVEDFSLPVDETELADSDEDPLAAIASAGAANESGGGNVDNLLGALEEKQENKAELPFGT